MIDREEVTNYAHLAGLTLRETGRLVHELETERDRLREALTSAQNMLSDFTTGEVDDPIDMAVDILSTALQEAVDE